MAEGIYNSDLKGDKTAIVFLSDSKYWNRAKRSIIDIRTRGDWRADIVFIAVDFEPNKNFIDYYRIIVKRFERINTDGLVEKIRQHEFIHSDGREYSKLTQWEKLHVFDDYFREWDRIFFIDAGLRIFDKVDYFLEIDYRGKFVSQNDNGFNGPNKAFGCQLELSNVEVIEELKRDIRPDILEIPYFLNCIWIYDTKLLDIIKKSELIEIMNKYPVCRTNEMGVMNILINGKLGLWKELPYKNSEGKYLFDWCEFNFRPMISWRDICALKYPVSINMECE
jgi:hypothetical protein